METDAYPFVDQVTQKHPFFSLLDSPFQFESRQMQCSQPWSHYETTIWSGNLYSLSCNVARGTNRRCIADDVDR